MEEQPHIAGWGVYLISMYPTNGASSFVPSALNHAFVQGDYSHIQNIKGGRSLASQTKRQPDPYICIYIYIYTQIYIYIYIDYSGFHFLFHYPYITLIYNITPCSFLNDLTAKKPQNSGIEPAITTLRHAYVARNDLMTLVRV